jgi:hypothetical protein
MFLFVGSFGLDFWEKLFIANIGKELYNFRNFLQKMCLKEQLGVFKNMANLLFVMKQLPWQKRQRH